MQSETSELELGTPNHLCGLRHMPQVSIMSRLDNVPIEPSRNTKKIPGPKCLNMIKHLNRDSARNEDLRRKDTLDQSWKTGNSYIWGTARSKAWATSENLERWEYFPLSA